MINNLKKKIGKFIEKKTVKNLNLEITKHVTGEIVLDNGCGNGSFVYEKHRDKQIYGCDINPGSVRNRGAVDFRLCNSIKLPYESDRFDCLVFSGVIQYVEDYEKSLGEIKRVLKNNGRLIIATVNRKSLFRKLGLINPAPKREGGEFNMFSFEELKKILIKDRFRIEKVLGVDFIRMPRALCSNSLIIAKNIKKF